MKCENGTLLRFRRGLLTLDRGNGCERLATFVTQFDTLLCPSHARGLKRLSRGVEIRRLSKTEIVE